MALYDSDGNIRVTVADGLSRGRYAPDGSLYVNVDSGNKGIYGANGCLNVMTWDGTNSVYNPDGGLWVLGGVLYSAKVLNVGVPSWVPAGALSAYNAMTGQSYRASTSFTRASTAWWDPSGTYLNYAVNVLRRADGVGMLLEAARTNVNTTFESAGWVAAVDVTVSAGTTPGPVAGGVGKTISGFVNSLSYASLNIVQALTIGQTWTGSVWLRASGSDIGKSARLRMARGAGGAFESSMTASLVLSGDWQRFDLSHTFVANHTAIRLDVQGDGTNPASALEVYGAQIELGAAASSPIVTPTMDALRPADALTFSPLSSIGTYDLNVRYDNDTEAVLASGVSGDQIVSAAALSRPKVKLLWAS